MSIGELIYAAATAAAARVLPAVAWGSGKYARGVRGMASSVPALVRWGADSRDPARPLVWFHAPSVGEGLQAAAVMQALRALRPEWQLAYTFFSPSAEAFAGRVPADVAAYLPIDSRKNAAILFDALRPSAVVFTKTEVWPGYVAEAGRRGIPVALASATLPPGSSRLRRPGRALLARTHGRLARVAAISQQDADRYAALGVPVTKRMVIGDARFDQVARRAARVDPAAGPLGALHADPRPTIVAGSTWPPDDDRLLPAVLACLHSGLPVRLIVAPHEPSEAHLARLESLLSALGLRHARLSTIEAGAGGIGTPAERCDVVVVDRLGVLGDLYALADVAYVGGGFGEAGLHSVLEPAAFGVPILFGPHHDNAREAAELIAAGAASAVTDGDHLETRLQAWLTDDAARQAAGSAALAYVESGLGAAERAAHLVIDLLEEG